MDSVQSQSGARSLGGVRTAGMLCAAGGAGWLVIGVVSLMVVQPTGTGFAISQMVWILVQSLLLIGVAGLSGAAPGGSEASLWASPLSGGWTSLRQRSTLS